MGEQPPLVRQWTLLRLLCSRRYGVTIREVIDEMGVSDKTVRRDLDTFVEAGFPLEEALGEHGRKTWRINPDKNQPWLTFAYDEAIALYLGRWLMEPLAGTPFWDASQRAFRKIRASLDHGALNYIHRFAAVFHQTMVGTSDYSRKAELIDRLMVGIEDCRVVFIKYRSLQATESVTYDIYPYGVAYHRGSLYLIGWAPQHGEIRTWKVDRIEAVNVEEMRFQPPEDFDLENYLAKSFGVFHGDGDVHVTIRFSPTVARYVQEKKWHPSQKLTAQKDGGLIAELDLDGTEEVKRWVLGFGQHAEVVDPEGLRKDIAKEIRVVLGRFRKSRADREERERKEKPR
jgi:proteasome accessory factor B